MHNAVELLAAAVIIYLTQQTKPLFWGHEKEGQVPENASRSHQIFCRPTGRSRLRCFNALAERREVSALRLAESVIHGQSQSLDLQREMPKETAILSQGGNDHGR